MGAHPYGAQLRPQQQSKNLPRVSPPAEVSNPISIIRERKKTTRWVIFSFLVAEGGFEPPKAPLRYPKKSSRIRLFDFSTAAQTPPSLYLPPAALAGVSQRATLVGLIPRNAADVNHPCEDKNIPHSGEWGIFFWHTYRAWIQCTML